MATAIATPVIRDLSRESLRVEHQVRIIRSDEEGTAFDKLPAGLYGFTNAPATETPVFATQNYRAFEVHKLADGTGCLLAHCSSEDAARLNAREEGEITAYPDPWERATILVAIPMYWITNSLHRVVRREGNAIPLRLAPR